MAMAVSTTKLSEKEIANDKAKRIMDGVAVWCSFYRANPHRFAEEYLGLHLYIYQQIILFMMNYCYYIIYLAARSQGKTYLTAVFCVIRCILYPGTKICVCSKNRGQGNLVLEKITTELMNNSANLRLEVEKYTVTSSKAYIQFRNGSRIDVVTASDSGRGARANILVIDEFRLVDLNTIILVLKKFLGTPRKPKYLDKPEYKHLTERNKEIYLSSCWYASHWSFNKTKNYFASMIDDKKRYFVCGLPYQLSIKEGLLIPEQVQDEMSESDFNEMFWQMEMECLFWNDADGSFFTYEDASKNRKLKTSIYPHYISKNISDKNLKIPDLEKGERRIISLDVALLASKKQNNDAASIMINSALPTSSDHYIGNIIYTENHEGLRTDELALKFRRLFEEYKCTDMVIDVKGIGLGVYDALIRDIYDPEYGVTYRALSCCNDKVYADRCADKSAPKVIWAIQATAQFNNDMYLGLREGLKQNRINLLMSEFDVEEQLKSIRGYQNMTEEVKMLLKMPYIHTTLLINELINLEYESKGTVVKVYEKSGMRKDRVSSLGYNYYVQCQLERKLDKSRQAVFDMSTYKNFARKTKILGH